MAAVLISWSGLAGADVSLPDGFALETRVSGPFSSDPVAFAFLPDGRVLVAERETGVVRLAPVGSLESVPIHTIPNVEAVNAPERGFLGVAVDPEWPARPFVYVAFTHTAGASHVVRLRAVGALTDPASADLSLAEPFAILTDIPDTHPNHNSGTLRFDRNGYLLVSTGDDIEGCNAQNLDDLRGKILRLRVGALPIAGSGPPPKAWLTPPDNPFLGPSANARLVFAWGLRNPFRFTVDAKTGELVVGDVGQGAYEEIDVVPPRGGQNFGWPQWEGKQPVTFFGDCGSGRAFTNPVFVVAHPPGLIAITGGPVLRSARAFPRAYEGSYFFFEFFTGDLVRLERGGTSWSIAPTPGRRDEQAWGTGLVGASDACVGPDGALYFSTIVSSFPGGAGVHRIAAAPADLAVRERMQGQVPLAAPVEDVLDVR